MKSPMKALPVQYNVYKDAKEDIEEKLIIVSFVVTSTRLRQS